MFKRIVRCRVTQAPMRDPIFEKGSIVVVDLLDGSVFQHSRQYEDGSFSAVTRDGGWYEFEPLPDVELPASAAPIRKEDSPVQPLTQEFIDEHFGGTPFGRKLKKIDKRVKRKRRLRNFVIFIIVLDIFFQILFWAMESFL